MRQITIDIYKYSELTGAAKERAKQWLIDAETQDAWFMDEINDTIKEINDIFNIDIYCDSYDNYCYNDDYAINYHDRDAIYMDFRRAVAYINNAFDFKRLPYRVRLRLREAQIRKPELKNKYPICYSNRLALAKNRYEDNLPTGVCYDYIIHDAYKNFIEAGRKNPGLTLDSFFRRLVKEVKRVVDAEYEYIQTDEYIDDMMNANEYEFTSDGKLYRK